MDSRRSRKQQLSGQWLLLKVKPCWNQIPAMQGLYLWVPLSFTFVISFPQSRTAAIGYVRFADMMHFYIKKYRTTKYKKHKVHDSWSFMLKRLHSSYHLSFKRMLKPLTWSYLLPNTPRCFIFFRISSHPRLLRKVAQGSTSDLREIEGAEFVLFHDLPIETDRFHVAVCCFIPCYIKLGKSPKQQVNNINQ